VIWAQLFFHKRPLRFFSPPDKGIPAIIDSLYSGIVARDERDASRTASPLKPAEDAVQIDTTNIGIEEVMLIIDRLVQENLS